MIKILDNMKDEYFQKVGIITMNSRVISYNNELVGIIDYDATEEYVKIGYITINDEYRRQGIAGEVIRMIMNENKGKYLYGDSLPGAIDFWASMGAEFHEDPFDDYLTPFSIEC